MIEHLLVPLDGSLLAESVLPAAASLAGALGAKVTLMHVVERDAPERVHGQEHLRDRAEAERYLAAVAARPSWQGIEVRWHVHEGDTGGLHRVLADHEPAFRHDLVVLCTHGAGGGRRMVLGSMAQRVVNAGTLPVLVLRPTAPAGAQGFRSILVPLDTDPQHSRGTAVAAEIARPFRAAIHLLMIVPRYGFRLGRWMDTGRLLPLTTASLLDIAERQGQQFLATQEAELEDSGISTESWVLRGDPVRRIVEAVRQIEPDLVVLATHGRSGARALFTGSVASRVSRRCEVPLLLVPAGRADAAEPLSAR
jgi:nucleotide-binding universal stress UspA family protein